ncbi:unnamed protein product [Staurois parvus]|uniref:Uncharacterized protein n=1 Tax=Staurois parvus TaxID=386267 RepID=A0ABN9HFT3_9NEOB|nr:unnamed protein product [Staurois parvus]
MEASGGIGREGDEDTEWRQGGGIGREGWRTLNGGHWRDWQRGVEDTEWRPVDGLAKRGGGH